MLVSREAVQLGRRIPVRGSLCVLWFSVGQGGSIDGSHGIVDEACRPHCLPKVRAMNCQGSEIKPEKHKKDPLENPGNVLFPAGGLVRVYGEAVVFADNLQFDFMLSKR